MALWNAISLLRLNRSTGGPLVIEPFKELHARLSAQAVQLGKIVWLSDASRFDLTRRRPDRRERPMSKQTFTKLRNTIGAPIAAIARTLTQRRSETSEDGVRSQIRLSHTAMSSSKLSRAIPRCGIRDDFIDALQSSTERLRADLHRSPAALSPRDALRGVNCARIMTPGGKGCGRFLVGKLQSCFLLRSSDLFSPWRLRQTAMPTWSSPANADANPRR
jgi:hypothetical protein